MLSVIASRASVLVVASLAGIAMLEPARVSAEWWRRGPVDYEECADAAEKAATKEDKTAALADCNAKFAGRRKPGGGYTYYDFLQDRSFDIAGPNPTPQEQKYIDQQYALYLEKQRRNSLQDAFAATQPGIQVEQPPLQQASLKSEPVVPKNEIARVPLPVQRPTKQQMIQYRAKACAKNPSFSCEWPRLSESISDLKKLLVPAPAGKPKRS
jgi:hypothetical protein